MTTSLSVPAFIEATLGKIPPAAAGDITSVEAILLAQANALTELFKHLLKAAFSHPEGSEKGNLALRLALRAQMQSGRLYQQLLRNKPAPRKAGGVPGRSRKPVNTPPDPSGPSAIEPPAGAHDISGTLPDLPESPEPAVSFVEEPVFPAAPPPGPPSSPVSASPPSRCRTALLEAAASLSGPVQKVPDPGPTTGLQSAVDDFPDSSPAPPVASPPAEESQSLLDVFPLAASFPRLAHIFGRPEERALGSPPPPSVD